MGKYFSLEIIKKKEKEKTDAVAQSNLMLQLAQKEVEIQNIKQQNATIMLEMAMLKGGM